MDTRRKPIPIEIQRRITKFFVTNLPEKCSGNDLASHVRQFGKIFGIYIARKRDKRGNRFGFISILDVKNLNELLKDLRRIRIGEDHLWFSMARFVLEDGEINNNLPKNYHADTTSQNHNGEGFGNLKAGKTLSMKSVSNRSKTCLWVRPLMLTAKLMHSPNYMGGLWWFD